MAIIKISTCGGTDVGESPSKAWIETRPCDFLLEIQSLNDTKKYRLTADVYGNLIVDTVSINGFELITDNGYPGVKFQGSY